MKICNKCKQEKDESEFYKDKSRISGIRSICKECYKRWYYHKEKNKQLYKKYQNRLKQYREDNRKKAKQYREDNRKKIREKAKQYYEKNKEKIKKKHNCYYCNNKEYFKKYQKKWIKKNRDKTKNYDGKYRARKNGSNGNVSDIEWKELCSHYGNICLRCGSSENITQDHVVPISKGGFHIIYNLQPLCKPCNSVKHNKTIDYRPDVISDFV